MVDECGVLMVVIFGGELLIYKEIGEIVCGFVVCKKFVLFCINVLLFEKKFDLFEFLFYLFFLVYFDGLCDYYDKVVL